MTTSRFGPPYCKINTAFKRDMSVKGNPVIPTQYSQPEFGYLRDNLWTWTEKVDGTNTRLHFNGTKVILGGRTDEAQIPTSLIEAITKLGLLDAESWLNKWPMTIGEDGGTVNPSVTLYGEGYGPKIQKVGSLYRDDVSFILFDVRIGNVWLKRESVIEIANYFGIDVVPYVGMFSLRDAWDMVCDDALTSAWENVPIEGIVGVPVVPLNTRMGSRIITKLKVRDWKQLEELRLH